VIAQGIQDIRGWKASPSLCEDNMNLDDLSCCQGKFLGGQAKCKKMAGKWQQVSTQIAADKWHLPIESLWDELRIKASKTNA
jgi:hypothetical protein